MSYLFVAEPTDLDDGPGSEGVKYTGLEMRGLVHLVHAAGLIKNGSGPDRSVLYGSGTDRSGSDRSGEDESNPDRFDTEDIWYSRTGNNKGLVQTDLLQSGLVRPVWSRQIWYRRSGSDRSGTDRSG